MSRRVKTCQAKAIVHLPEGLVVRTCDLEKNHDPDHHDERGAWKVESQ